jgi:hypothetical protein
MEIAVDVKDVSKLVMVDVEKSHTIGQVIDEIVESLDLPKDKHYVLVSGSKSFGPERYSARITDLAPNEGHRLLLTSQPTVVPVAPPPGRQEKINRRRYLKAAGAAAVAGVGLAAAYISLSFPKPPTESGIQPLPVTSIVTRTVTTTTTPSTSSPRTTTQITSTRTTTTGLASVTDLWNFVVTRGLPNYIEFMVDYSYGPDKLDLADFASDQPAFVLADLAFQIPDSLKEIIYVSGGFQCNQETKRGRGSSRLLVCISPKKKTSADIAFETSEVRLRMSVTDYSHVFFEKSFNYHKIWQKLTPCVW